MKYGVPIVSPSGIEAAMDPFALAICSVAVSDRAYIDPNLADQCTLYAVHVQNALSGRSWVVYRRYSDFALFRERIVAHLQSFAEIVPKAFNSVMLTKFPKKKPFPRKSTLRHRQVAFLTFLRDVHDILLDREYYLHQDICYVGFAIFKAFIGSHLHPLYSNIYFIKKTVPQYKLPIKDRSCVIQCGSLATVLEEPETPIVSKRVKSEAVIEMSMTASMASDDEYESTSESSWSSKSKIWKSKGHLALNVKKLATGHWFSAAR